LIGYEEEIMDKTEETPPAYTPEEVAERLNVSVATVHEFLRDGRLKGFKLTRQWRIERADVEEFIRRQTVTNEPSNSSN
jgi:excisionase family DNA binding protein